MTKQKTTRRMNRQRQQTDTVKYVHMSVDDLLMRLTLDNYSLVPCQN